MEYLPRVADASLQAYLRAFGGVLLEGARATGKTSTAMRHCSSFERLDRSPDLVELARLSPDLLLEGATPRLIDEWQLAPTLWNAARYLIDDRQSKGQFILSGSAVPVDDVTRHTGAGRFGRLRMRPMALQESGASTGSVSMADLVNSGRITPTRSPLSYGDMAVEAVRGGWPALVGATAPEAGMANASYLDDVVRADVPDSVGTRHDPARVRRVLQSLARNVATEATLPTLAADVEAHTGAPTNHRVVGNYLDSLRRVFVTEFLPAWSVGLRSRSRLRTAEKIHFVDPSLACAALNVDAVRLARDVEYFGFIFESMVIRDLRVYAAPLRGELFHYRDNTGLEVDAVIEFPGGRWAAVEVKLGEARVAEAESHLLKLARERVDTARAGEPMFLAVVTASEFARTLPSGVHVIPLGTLGP